MIKKIFILLLLLATVTFAQPTFVTKTEGSNVGTTLTLNIAVSTGTNRMLVVGLAYKSNSVITPTSIVFNTSETFSVEHAGTDVADAQCLLYYLPAPTETTADVVITMPISVRMVGYVAYVTGVNQSNPFTASTVQAGGNSDTPTIDISSSATELVFDIMAQVSNGPYTITSNTGTLICSGAATGGGTDTRGGGQYQVGTGTRTMGYTTSDTRGEDWNIIAGALQVPSTGWTGKINGVTNPAKINGIAVSGISKVNGK